MTKAAGWWPSCSAGERRAARADFRGQTDLGHQLRRLDGNSGITANPALGAAADLLVAAGGTVVLAETTELYGAEQLLTRRAVSPAVADKLLERIRWWEWYAGVYG